MKTSIFDFELPPERIASQPIIPRDASKMLVVAEGLSDQKITDLLKHLRSGDVMVFNDTKVIPARLMGIRGEAKIEILLHKKIKNQQWQCFAKPAKRLKIGDTIEFANDFNAVVLHKYDDGQVLIDFSIDDEIFYEKLQKYGTMPLPPYIEKQRTDTSQTTDNENYQTVYAKYAGSVAAPTAGLHFTEKLLADIDALGLKRVFVTLHVGGGTFLPVKVENTADHIMHSEFATITKEVADIINDAKTAGGRVIAVGTTSVRTLETATNKYGIVQEFSGETNIFITPSYKFKIVDLMLTNFHLPKSTLFMLVCAFAGTEKMQATYAYAIENNYRFYSYGDACFLYRQS